MNSLKILIIEDETNLARTLAQALRLGSDGEYQVDTAPSAEKAYSLIDSTEYDLVISDLKLPGDDGLTLITKVKESSPGTHTILMTGYGSNEVEGQADTLTEGYLTKPFDLLDLLHMVQKILSQPSSQHDAALKRQDLAKDDHRRILIMEDDRGLRRIYTKALSKSRYWVDEAATILAARRLLQENQYAIFVCDLRMGRDLGTDLLDEFREKFQRQGTHIVICSEYGHYRYLSEEMGAEYFLEKPIALTTLLTLVNRLSEPL